MNQREEWEQQLERAPFAEYYGTQDLAEKVEQRITSLHKQRPVRRIASWTTAGVAVAGVVLVFGLWHPLTWWHTGQQRGIYNRPPVSSKPLSPVNAKVPNQVIARWIADAKSGDVDDFIRYTYDARAYGEKMKSFYEPTVKNHLFEDAQVVSIDPPKSYTPPSKIDLKPDQFYEFGDTSVELQVKQKELGTANVRDMKWKLHMIQNQQGNWFVDGSSLALNVPLPQNQVPLTKGPIEHWVQYEDGQHTTENWHDLQTGEWASLETMTVNDLTPVEKPIITRKRFLYTGQDMYMWIVDEQGKTISAEHSSMVGSKKEIDVQPKMFAMYSNTSNMNTPAFTEAPRGVFNGRNVKIVTKDMEQANIPHSSNEDPSDHVVSYYDEETGYLLKQEHFINGVPRVTTYAYEYLPAASEAFVVPKGITFKEGRQIEQTYGR